MKRFKKYIGLLFILLSGILISAHELIPHHHHFDSVYSHTSESPFKTTPDTQHGNHEDSSSHCHAFNDSFVDRILTARYNFVQPEYFFIAIVNTETELQPEVYLSNIFTFGPVCFKQHNFPDSDPLRGPPQFI
ncbi:hypothetical protein ACE1ET_11225 [Saccharicrinis sp. FJH62]|uniref:hypothetical protein n=1 Tax=Saccharicrinis sp. FJH62 TaxID=3344657 RepID=UPI0035D47E77